MQILAATDFSTRSNRALRQAGLLAQRGGTQLDVVHVVDDDQPQDLIRLEVREAERLLSEQMASMPELQGIQCRPMVITGDPFDGILRVAAQASPKLVVMGTHRKELLRDIFVGTTIERVIRNGAFPVLMVNNEAQRHYAKVVAPVDLSDASANTLKAAMEAGFIGENGAMLLHAFLAPGKGKMTMADADQKSIDNYIERERQRATDELTTFLAANNLSRERWSFRVEEGAPMQVISRTISELRPDILIMGTHSRKGLLKAFIGSVAEAALRTLNVDILVVPPVKS